MRVALFTGGPRERAFYFLIPEIARLRWYGYQSWQRTGLMVVKRRETSPSRPPTVVAAPRAMQDRSTRSARFRGYPEDGKHAWRAGNDDTIVAAVDKYNSENGYQPGDQEYMTPQLMKAWMMQESGGSPDAFKTDPFQVNNPGDWDPAKANKSFAGLSQGQIMTPETSAEAALKWLHYKGRIDTSENSPNRGRWVPYQGHYEALRNYNAAASPVPGVPKGADYANSVLNKAWASYGDWQQ